MTYDEFRRQLGKAGLTAKGFAEMICLNPNSVTNYATRGTVPHHLAVIAILMGEMADKGLDFRAALLSLGTARDKSRGTATPRQFGGHRQSGLF